MNAERNDQSIDKPFHSAGETIDVLATVPLADTVPAEATPLGGRRLRMRRVVVEPGGVIAAHAHADRPAILYLVTGSLLEFTLEHDLAVEHVAPAVVVPRSEHWWRNAEDQPAVFVGADLVDPSDDASRGC